MNYFIFLVIKIILVSIFSIILFIKNKSINYKKILLFFSIFYLLTIFSSFFYNNLTIKIIIDILLFITFIVLSLYITINYSQKFEKIIEAFNSLSSGKTDYVLKIKMKDDLKTLARLYLQLNMNFNALIANVTQFSKELFNKMSNLYEKSANVKKGINDQQDFSKNLDYAISLQGESLNIGAKGLDDTRLMFTKTMADFNNLFNLINSLFEQNQQLLKENKNMENYSNTAIDFTKNLEKVTVDGTEKIDSIINFIDNLDKSINNIKSMIIMIKKITSQTNLLAINASIEAAHAGEYGMGFGVVASEIRNLAESSSNATQNMTIIVDNIFQEMEKGKNFSNLAKEGIKEITEAIKKTIQLISSVSNGINKQIKSVLDMKEIIEKIHSLSNEIKNSSDYQQKRTQEIYEATENLNSQAIIINSLITNQKLQLNDLLNMIDELYAVIDESNTYSKYLIEIVNKFSKPANQTNCK